MDCFTLNIQELRLLAHELSPQNLSYWHNKTTLMGQTINLAPNTHLNSTIKIEHNNGVLSQNTLDNLINKEQLIPTIKCAIVLDHYLPLFETLHNIILKNIQLKDVKLRIAGGFVRDFLLSTNTSDININTNTDIDIAIENMTGQEFINSLLEYCPELITKSITISQNSQKSKHLEVQVVDFIIKGITYKSIDFVGLRKETYDGKTRIPTIQNGTIIDDAFRRDLTINSLYYNIHTDQIEDYTNGLTDIYQKILKPPGNPANWLTIYIEDPLRIIRLARFAANLNATVPQELIQLINDPTIHHILKHLIAPSRIWSEFNKITSTTKMNKMCTIIHQMNLWPTILKMDVEFYDLNINNQICDIVDHPSEILIPLLIPRVKHLIFASANPIIKTKIPTTYMRDIWKFNNEYISSILDITMFDIHYANLPNNQTFDTLYNIIKIMNTKITIHPPIQQSIFTPLNANMVQNIISNLSDNLFPNDMIKYIVTLFCNKTKHMYMHHETNIIYESEFKRLHKFMKISDACNMTKNEDYLNMHLMTLAITNYKSINSLCAKMLDFIALYAYEKTYGPHDDRNEIINSTYNKILKEIKLIGCKYKLNVISKYKQIVSTFIGDEDVNISINQTNLSLPPSNIKNTLNKFALEREFFKHFFNIYQQYN